MTTGEKWTRRFRMEPGKNTIRIVGTDLNSICIQYVRKNGPLEMIPQGRFKRQFYKMDKPKLKEVNYLIEFDKVDNNGDIYAKGCFNEIIQGELR